MRATTLCSVPLLLLLAAAGGAQEQPPTIPPASGQVPAANSPLIASGWCVVAPKEKQGSASAEQGADKQDAGPGCDAGVGIALAHYRRVYGVGIMGTKTLGFGIAWLVYKPTPRFPRSIALGLGAVTTWDSSGLGRKLYPALGATITLFKQSNE